MLAACCAHAGEAQEVVPLEIKDTDGAETKQSVLKVNDVLENQCQGSDCEALRISAPTWSEATSFDCSLHGSHGSGLTVDVWPSHLQVVSVSGGSAEAYNASSFVDARILPNDFIVMVNGTTKPLEMKKKLSCDAAVAIKVVHPSSLVVKMDKGGSTLGMKLAIHEKSGSCLCIDQIEEGAAQKYNSGKDAESQLASGDLIASVNGVDGVATKMIEEIRSSEVVELAVLRLPRSSTH